MCHFNNPSSCFEIGILDFFFLFFTPRTDMQNIVFARNDFFGTRIACIKTKILLFILCHFRSQNNYFIQCFFQQFYIVSVRSVKYNRQRYILGISQNTPFGSHFFPERSGYDLLLHEPMGLLSYNRPRSAIPNRFLFLYHILPMPLPIISQKNPLLPIPENTCADCCPLRILWVRLSIDTLFLKHREFLPIPFGAVLVFCLDRACSCMFYFHLFVFWESHLSLFPITHLTASRSDCISFFLYFSSSLAPSLSKLYRNYYIILFIYGQVLKLIEQGKMSLIKGFKDKDGSKEFDAYLVVDKIAKKIIFEFPAKNKATYCQLNISK